MQTTEQTDTSNGETTWQDAADASAAAEIERRLDVEQIKQRCVEKRTYQTRKTIPLPPEETAALGLQIAENQEEIEKLEERRKGINEDIKELKSSNKSLGREIRAAKGERQFEVTEYWDEDGCHVYLVRTDTQELVEDRTMSGLERQGEIDYSDGHAADDDETEDESDPEETDEDSDDDEENEADEDDLLDDEE